jgi:hypothetical protein
MGLLIPALLFCAATLAAGRAVQDEEKGEQAWDLHSDDPDYWLQDLPEKYQNRDYSSDMTPCSTSLLMPHRAHCVLARATQQWIGCSTGHV